MVLVVHAFAGVFLHVYVVDSYFFRSTTAQSHQNRTAETNRHLVLRNLIALGQIGIKIIFAGKTVAQVYSTIAGQPHFNCILNHPFVNEWQRARMPKRNRTDMLVWPATKS